VLWSAIGITTSVGKGGSFIFVLGSLCFTGSIMLLLLRRQACVEVVVCSSLFNAFGMLAYGCISKRPFVKHKK
jgi:O-antigen ligase